SWMSTAVCCLGRRNVGNTLVVLEHWGQRKQKMGMTKRSVRVKTHRKNRPCRCSITVSEQCGHTRGRSASGMPSEQDWRYRFTSKFQSVTLDIAIYSQGR